MNRACASHDHPRPTDDGPPVRHDSKDCLAGYQSARSSLARIVLPFHSAAVNRRHWAGRCQDGAVTVVEASALAELEVPAQAVARVPDQKTDQEHGKWSK